MIAAATPMRTSVRAKVTSLRTTTRSHDAISPIPPARTGPVDGGDRRHGGVHQPLRTARTTGAESGGPLRRSLRSAPAQNAGGVWVSTIDADGAVGDRGLGAVEGGVQIADELARQRVAVGGGVERDRRHAVGDRRGGRARSVIGRRP